MHAAYAVSNRYMLKNQHMWKSGNACSICSFKPLHSKVGTCGYRAVHAVYTVYSFKRLQAQKSAHVNIGQCMQYILYTVSKITGSKIGTREYRAVHAVYTVYSFKRLQAQKSAHVNIGQCMQHVQFQTATCSKIGTCENRAMHAAYAVSNHYIMLKNRHT
jgi:hypothetical protein